MFDVFKKIFGKQNFESLLEKINSFEPKLEKLTDDELKKRSLELKNQFQEKENDLDSLVPEAFALVREAAKRTLNQRHYDTQLIGGIVLCHGQIAEMATGEGKTLAATAPAYLYALSGKGTHVITVNDYLARRDTVWMGQIYWLLGLSVGCLTHEQAFLYDPNYVATKKEDKSRDVLGGFKIFQDFLRPISRKEAYLADITYGTNHEFGFDYLRDNLAYNLDQRVQREHNYAIIDEIDSILIDEAGTPLIIAAPDSESSEFYKIFARIVQRLQINDDYIADEKIKHVDITDDGIEKVEKILKIKNLYSQENLRLVHYLNESLRAKALFKKDKQYIIENGEVVIIDEYTGRKMYGRRYSGGLHQAIEAKENVNIQQESKTYAQITIQNYFRLYKKISGMTGTAQTSAEEFHKVYNLEVVTIPTNKPMARKNYSDAIYKNLNAKYQAVIEEIKKRHYQGQPLLIGTASINHNEMLSKLLKQANIKHELLNAKNHEREGAIIAQAGKLGAVTLATNMAGRGVDIILGGNPSNEEEAKKIKELGGLHVIGTERHTARRIDNQLRGRAGRQGDPGSSQFFLSLEDDLIRIFGGEKIKSLMETFKMPENQPIESQIVTKAVNEAQKKIEGFNFDSRKHLLEYDDVLNRQRTAVYNKRLKLLEQKTAPAILSMLDLLWMNHLEDMEALRESVGMRAYGQHEPLIEYRRESRMIFDQMMQNFENWVTENKERIEQMTNEQQQTTETKTTPEVPQIKAKVGRNDPCPCGAKRPDGHPIKYKHCCGKNL